MAIGVPPSPTAKQVWIVANTTWYVFNFRRRLLETLTARGYSVTVLSPVDDYVAPLHSLGARHIHLEMDNAGTNPLRDLGLMHRLIALFRRERPALLLTFTPKVNIYGSIAARACGVPVIANISGLGTGFIRGGWLGRLIKLLYRVALRHPRRIFFQNEDDHRLFVGECLAPAGASECLPGSGVDLERFRPMPAAGRGEAFTFLMVARLLRDKGVREYVEAARMVRERDGAVQFDLVGFLDAKNPTAIAAADVHEWQRRGWVRYHGPTDDPRAYYARADCVVLPSYREGCPRTLLEAASMAKPIITTDVPGCRQVVEVPATGLLVRVADAADLAEKMLRMLALSAAEREGMGRLGREKMQREFDENLVLRRYAEAVERILSPALADP